MIRAHFGKIQGSTQNLHVPLKTLKIHLVLIDASFHGSNFSDVFDEDYFIHSLANDVKIMKKLPKEFAAATKSVKYFKSWSGIEYYRDKISQLWDYHKVWYLYYLKGEK